MLIKNFLTLLLICISLYAYSQQKETFEKKLHVSGINKAITTEDGNYLVHEIDTDSYGMGQSRLSLFDPFGKLLREEIIKLFDRRKYTVTDLLETTDHKYILIGSVDITSDGGSPRNSFIAQLDADFKLVWIRYIEEEQILSGIKCVSMPDNSIVVSYTKGYNQSENKDSEVNLLQLSSAGEVVNRKSIGAANGQYETNRGLVLIDDVLYLVYTSYTSYTKYTSWWTGEGVGSTLAILDGNLEVVKSVFSSDFTAASAFVNNRNELVLKCEMLTPFKLIFFSNSLDYLTEFTPVTDFGVVDVQQNNDGTYLLAGHSFESEQKGFSLLLLNESLEVINQKRYFRSGSKNYGSDRVTGALATPDGGFMLYGSISNALGSLNYSYLIKTDEAGELNYPVFSKLPAEAIGFRREHPWDTKMYWFDIDQDGDPDMIRMWDDGNVVFLNVGEEKLFERSEAFLPPNVGGSHISAADYDNDGDTDLYISAYGYMGSEKNNTLLIKKENGTFELAENISIVKDEAGTMSSEWQDLNHDGYLDLILNNLYNIHIYYNRGDGSFSDKLILAPEQEVYSTDIGAKNFWYDLNKDGLLDVLHVSSKTIFLQTENNKFERVDFYSLFEIDLWSYHHFNPRCVKAFDIDGDGIEELVTASVTLIVHSYDTQLKKWVMIPYNNNQVQIHNNPTNFTLIDFENDGDSDLFFNGRGNHYEDNGHLQSFHLNIGSGNYTYLRNFDPSILMSHFSWVDLNQDGALELVKSNEHFFEIYQNLNNTNSWLTIKLKGNRSTQDALSTLVELYTNGKKQYQLTSDNTGYNGTISNQAHFGLGKFTAADSVIIKWQSGCIQVLKNIAANQVLEVEENCSGKPPVVAPFNSICTGSTVEINITSPGTNFNWYESLDGPTLGSSGTTVLLDTLTQSRTFYIANTDSSMTSRRTAVPVKINPQPYVSITRENHRLIASSGSQYQWYFEGTPITAPEGTKSEIHAEANGSYSVVIWNEYGCTAQSDALQYILGTEDLLSGDSGRLYPNPGTDWIKIEGVNQAFNYTLISIRGEIIRKGKAENGSVDIKQLAQGTYFLQVQYGSTFATFRFIKLNK